MSTCIRVILCLTRSCLDNFSLSHLNLCPHHICISTNINNYTNILVNEDNLMDILDIIKMRKDPIIIVLDLKDLSKYLDKLIYNGNIVIIH